VASGAAHRGRNRLRLGVDVGGRWLLLQIGPFEFREIDGKLAHVGRIDGGGYRRHDVVLARAALEVAELIDQIARVLASNHRDVLLDGDTRLAVARGARFGLRFDGILGECALAHEHRRREKGRAAVK
jgi:hypothetical protein